MVRDWPREPFPRNPYVTERYGVDSIDDSHYAETQDMQRRQPPMGVDEALRQCCSIPAKTVFVAVVMDDGTSDFFSSPRLPDEVTGQFFNMAAYRQVMSQVDAGVPPVVEGGFGFSTSNGSFQPSADYSRSRMVDRRRSNFEDWDISARQTRKRPRPRHVLNDEDDGPPVAVVTTKEGIKISDSEKVMRHYEKRLRDCQQTACKLIAKAWVKAVEPKKQSTHPYTGSDAKAPDWWPKPWGLTKEEKVRHKEPDHLYKRERVHLLQHILHMIVEPNATQHPDIKKLNLNVKKLEEITTEALSAFFADKENPANAKKRPYLNEIFKLAKQQERYKNGEIDGTTEVFVMGDEKVPEAYPSENDDAPLVKEEDEDISPTKSAITHNMISTTTTDHSPATTMNGSSFMSDLPVRGHSYQGSVMPDIAPEQHGYVEGNGMPVNGHGPVHAAGGNIGIDMAVPHPHDSSRRTSLFNASSDYASQNGTGLYSQQWQPGSTAPTTSSMYTFTHQPPNPSPPFVNSGVPMNQSQPYLNTSFDGLSRAGYDPSQASIFRTSNVPQPQVHPSQGYNYLSHDTRGLPGIKVDQPTRMH